MLIKATIPLSQTGSYLRSLSSVMQGICRIATSIHDPAKPCSSSWLKEILNLKSNKQHHKQVQYSMGISRSLVAVLFGVFYFLSVVNGEFGAEMNEICLCMF